VHPPQLHGIPGSSPAEFCTPVFIVLAQEMPGSIPATSCSDFSLIFFKTKNFNYLHIRLFQILLCRASSSAVLLPCRCLRGVHVPGVSGRPSGRHLQGRPPVGGGKRPQLHGRTPVLHLQFLWPLRLHGYSLLLVSGLYPPGLQGEPWWHQTLNALKIKIRNLEMEIFGMHSLIARKPCEATRGSPGEGNPWD